MILFMRMNLISHSTNASTKWAGSLPVSLTLRPSRGVAGEYVYPTDSVSLMRMLRSATDLAMPILSRFEGDLWKAGEARLSGVELSEKVLEKIGYFVD